ncbi:MAG: NAD(+)/NADH kinase [Clostridia bacterium]|nr:NAD(+)/NADH kinase [Clostridia bacterium]
MHCVGILASPAPRAQAAARRAEAFLAARGVVYSRDVEAPGAERPEALVALGGDGTVLWAARAAVRLDVPLLGINLGQVGFLAEVEAAGMEEALAALLAGDYSLEERPLLSVRAGDVAREALNDVVVSRGGYPRLIRVQAVVDGCPAGTCRADGLVVATPTGSTGYSLSAGGPIVAPGVDCMILTPICAHSLQHRPQVVPGGAVVSLRLDPGEPSTASLQVDGEDCALLHAGDRVEIRRSPRRVRFIRMGQQDFFDVVHRKLSEWTR